MWRNVSVTLVLWRKQASQGVVTKIAKLYQYYALGASRAPGNKPRSYHFRLEGRYYLVRKSPGVLWRRSSSCICCVFDTFKRHTLETLYWSKLTYNNDIGSYLTTGIKEIDLWPLSTQAEILLWNQSTSALHKDKGN